MFGFGKTPQDKPKPTEHASIAHEQGFKDAFTFLAKIFQEKAKIGNNRATRRHCSQIAELLRSEIFQRQCLRSSKSHSVIDSKAQDTEIHYPTMDKASV